MWVKFCILNGLINLSIHTTCAVVCFRSHKCCAAVNKVSDLPLTYKHLGGYCASGLRGHCNLAGEEEVYMSRFSVTWTPQYKQYSETCNVSVVMQITTSR